MAKIKTEELQKMIGNAIKTELEAFVTEKGLNQSIAESVKKEFDILLAKEKEETKPIEETKPKEEKEVKKTDDVENKDEVKIDGASTENEDNFLELIN